MESLLSKPARNEMEHPARNKIQIRIAVAGNSGVGKSAFINAIRRVDDDDNNNAARVGILETTREPTEYKHPKNPMASFVELPGYGTPSIPDLQTFCKKINFNDYDVFLILSNTRFTRNDLELAMKLESIRKLLFVVRTKIDLDCCAEQRKKSARFDEMKVLEEIRDDCKQIVGHFIQSDDHVFLISNYYRDRWDFERLAEAICAQLPKDQREDVIPSFPKAGEIEKKRGREERGKEITEKKKESQTKEMETAEIEKEEIGSTEGFLADARAYFNENAISGIHEFLTKKLNEWKNVKIRFGITGDPGTGKSTFINAIRGLCDGDCNKDAAKVGVVETTTKPREYRHPDNPMICLVDLPGIGTPNYPDLETYCRDVDFDSYDTFLIFTATRFTANDLELAKKIKSLGKSLFLIRSKIDNDLRLQKGKATRDESIMLLELRNDCIKCVKGMISSEDNIFLISSHEKEKWDFDGLVQAISEALPVLQKESLILSLSNLTRGCLRRKANFLKDYTAGLTERHKSPAKKLPSTQTPGTPISCQCSVKSIMHREMLMKLHEKAKNHPDGIREINGVRVCCSQEFVIGKGSDGTRVYAGLGKDGVEKAVKRLPRDACTGLAHREKEVLNESNPKKSKYVVNYWFLEEQSDEDYLYLILDLCEETLEKFVKRSTLIALVKIAPEIIQQVLKGLVDLHRGTNPILHRDLKPSNILRDFEDNWLLADFGISRILSAGVRTHVTNSSGTEDWKAVESCSCIGVTDDDKSGNVRFKKESDIQVCFANDKNIEVKI